LRPSLHGAGWINTEPFSEFLVQGFAAHILTAEANLHVDLLGGFWRLVFPDSKRTQELGRRLSERRFGILREAYSFIGIGM
jgi:hypothetical protein